jgi:DNA polymerase-3 subunit gamma/tau
VDWLLELDAASNNGVANIRELIERIPLGTSGNRKVVILDEVHMLSTGAANALLKSLEEPPAHVVFILATTDPQKVLPTIRSRTQHFEFHLLTAEVLAEHVRFVIKDAKLKLGEDAVEHVVRVGGGSARDTLSALDQVSAMGGVVQQSQPIDAILAALTDRDAGAALVAVAEATDAGRDPRALGEALIAALRDAFLAVMGAPDRHRPAPDLERAATVGAALGAAGLTRALEVLGEALVELAKKPDPRIVIEVALVRLCRPDADRSLDAVLDRLERVERALAGGAVGGGGGADEARAELARSAPAPKAAPAPAAPAPAPAAPTRARVTKATAPKAAAPAAKASPPAAEAAPAPAAKGGDVPSRDELTLAWGDSVLDALPRGARAIFSTGRFVDGDGSAAVFALANAPTRDHCEKKRGDVEAALAAHFGRPVRLRLVTDAEVGGAPVATPAPESAPTASAAPAKGRGRLKAAPVDEVEDVGDVRALEDAPSGGSGAERLAEAFPGAELIDEG